MQSQKFKIHVSPTYAIVKFKMKMGGAFEMHSPNH